MSLKVPDVGLTKCMDDLSGTWSSIKIRLFKNNITPAGSSVIGDFTECDFAGYTEQTVGSWGAATMASNTATTTGSQVTFTRSTTGTAQNIYGYYVVEGTSLIWAERDPAAPVVVTNAGDNYKVTPKLTMKSEF